MNNEKFEINIDNTVTIEVNYYRKNMGTYNVHVFFCNFETEESLKKSWKTIANEIALEYQTRNLSEIERANFYIAYFLNKNISSELQNIIELDPYCARKYVFDGQEHWGNQQEIISKRIFELDLKNMPLKNNRNRLCKIQLQNFRGYAGKAIFDLTDRQGNPAAFVLIYAPNGIGKTSFMDGIEFALKGEVKRLVDLKKQAKYNGPIYHHYDKVEQKAFVQLFAQNDTKEVIPYKPRKVPRYENGSDANVDNRSYKNVFKCSKDDWNLVILPHDKIDSFITANSPEKRFDTWTKTDEKIGAVAEKLKSIRQTLKNNEKIRNNAIDEIKKQEKLIDDLKLKREGLNRVIKMVEEYNNLTENTEEKLPGIEINADVQRFSDLITEARALLEEYQREIQKLEKSNMQLSGWLMSGPEKCDLKYKEFQDKEQEKIDLERQKNLLAERIQIKRQLQQEELKLNNLKTKRSSYSELEIYGIEKIFAELTKWKKIISDISLAEKRILEVTSAITENKKKIGKIEIQIKEINFLLHSKEDAIKKAEELCKSTGQINALKSIIENITNQEKAAITKKWCFDYSILDEQNIDGSLKNRLLEKSNSLFDLKEKLKVVDTQIHELLSKHEVQENEIHTLQEQAINFLEKNKDNCQCPVCHSKFDSWKELVLNIKNIKSNEQKMYELHISKALDEKDTIQKVYESEFDETYKILIILRDLILKDIKDLNAKIESIKKWFLVNKIQVHGKDNVLSYIRDYYISTEIHLRQIEEEKLQLENDNSELNIEKESLINEKNSNQLEVSNRTSSYLSLLEDAEKLEADYRNGTWDRLVKECNDLRKNIDKLTKRLYDFDQKHSDITCISEEFLATQRNIIEKRLEENGPFAKVYAPYFMNSSLLKREYQNGKIRYNICLDRVSKLRRIVNEEGVKDYLNSWKDANADYALKKEKELTAQEKYKQSTIECDKLTKTLKEQLEEYFSQANANIIYQKIDPNSDLTDMKFSLTFTEDNRPQLSYEMTRKNQREDGYLAELYLSTAQLNAVAFSSFFARALMENCLDFHSIIIDDPIGSFDDMNILGFADLIRSIIMNTDVQIIMTTHDSKIFDIMQRKLNGKYHNTRFYRLPEDLIIVNVDDPDSE